jgi:uncharacterized repeat protein (TIGR03803 family)
MTQRHVRLISKPANHLKPLAMALVIAAFCLAAAQVSSAQVFSTLVSFDQTNGANPDYGALVQGINGNLYGTAENGGERTTYGIIFEISDTGAFTPLYRFCSLSNCLDGRNPFGGLVLGDDGNFYGTTTYGGAYSTSGTIFKLTPAGKLTTLHSFCAHTDVGGFCTDGAFPDAAPVQANNGYFYGTTSEGGGPNGNYGVVYKISSSGSFATVYRFCSLTGCTDGADPVAGLILGTDGNLYGTASSGGAYGGGTVYKITPEGAMTILYNFCAHRSNGECPDGAQPRTTLVQASNGNFYGTTGIGGAITTCGFDNSGCGTIFEITSAGAFSTVYNFCSEAGCDDGSYPNALVLGTDGNFYGTAGVGGIGNRGTVFQFTPAGALTVYYSFCTTTGCTDGAGPVAGLVQSTNGAFYGTTYEGGTNNIGTVFLQSVGLDSFVETVPGSRPVGGSVIILGNNLTGSSSVTFNGTAAAFTILSNTEIKATVPTGATTGPVEVVTTGGTLTSNAAFQVQP